MVFNFFLTIFDQIKGGYIYIDNILIIGRGGWGDFRGEISCANIAINLFRVWALCGILTPTKKHYLLNLYPCES